MNASLSSIGRASAIKSIVRPWVFAGTSFYRETFEGLGAGALVLEEWQAKFAHIVTTRQIHGAFESLRQPLEAAIP